MSIDQEIHADEPEPTSAGGVSIRSAVADDLTAAAELRWQWVQELDGEPVVDHDVFLTVFTEWAVAHTETHHCLVARRAEAVIGMAWLAVVPRVPSARALERASGDLQCVYVVPAERNAGVGARLLAAVRARADELGLERVTVHSSADAISAYRRAGFVVSERLLQSTLGA